MTSRDKLEEKIAKARTQLLLNHPFFGTLALYLTPKRAEWLDPPSMATDGRHLFYFPDFVKVISMDQLIATIAHEILHIILQHPFRRGTRELARWNASCDFAANSILVHSRFELPEGSLYSKVFDGLSAEEIYEKIPSGSQYKEFDCHFDFLLPNGMLSKEDLDKWKARIARARMLPNAGKLLPWFEEQLKELFEAKISWEELLRKYLVNKYKDDYRWCPPNKKFIHMGIMLPSVYSEGIGDILVVVDTSGSVRDYELQQFFGEIQKILDSFKCKIHLVQHDTEVRKYEIYNHGDVLNLNITGRGGTSHTWFPSFVQEEMINPEVIIFFTDADTDWFNEQPKAPAIIVTPFDHGKLPKWRHEHIIMTVGEWLD